MRTGRETQASALAWLVRVVTAAGLGVDAAIHLLLAPNQPPAGPSGGWSQIDLFYAEAAVSILAALVVLVSGIGSAYVFGFLVAASALGAVVLYRYVDVGALGPLPNMYSPYWSASKIATAIAEVVAVLASAAGVLLRERQYRAHPGSAVA